MTCSVSGCDRPTLAKGWCRRHYDRNAKYGSPTASTPPPRNREWPGRFWAKVNKTETCWLWTGSATKPSNGYGQIRYQGRMAVAHRVAYELLKGPIPAGLDLDHLCRVRLCVNPSHLEPVTPYENFRRGDGVMAEMSRQTHCKRGHELSGDNVSIVNNGRSRRCRACRRQSQRKIA